MSADYDRALSDRKHQTTQALLRLQRENPNVDVQQLACEIDDLNKAWDALTDALVRQRVVYQRKLAELVCELAESEKERRG